VHDDFDSLFARFEDLGPARLTTADAERLAHLIQSDPRCCSKLPKSFGSRRARQRFRRILTQAWIEEGYAEVLDYRPRLLRSASQHRRRQAPLVALVLYATWVEHTVNAIVIGAARMTSFQGSVDDLARRIVAEDFPVRVSRIWSRYKAPRLDRTMKGRMLRLMELRNDFVHYKWIGLAPATLQAELTHMRTIVTNAPSLVTYLRGLEREITTVKFRPRIRKLLKLRTSRVPAA